MLKEKRKVSKKKAYLTVKILYPLQCGFSDVWKDGLILPSMTKAVTNLRIHSGGLKMQSQGSL